MPGETLTTISPTNNRPILTRPAATSDELTQIPKTAHTAFLTWSKTSLPERQKIIKKALQLILEKQDELAREVTEQMGRPISYTNKEITTAVARGEYMLKVSGDVLADTPGEKENGFTRYIRKMPLGVVLVIFAWNVRFSIITSNISPPLCYFNAREPLLTGCV